MDSTTRFTDRVEDYVRYRPGYPAAEILAYLSSKIALFESTLLQNNQVLDYEGVKGRLTSSSYIPAPGVDNYQLMIDTLESIFNKHAVDGKVVFGYTTKVYLGKA